MKPLTDRRAHARTLPLSPLAVWRMALLPLVPVMLAASAKAAEPPAAPAAAPALETVRVRAVARFGFDRTEIAPADRQALLAEVAQLKDVTWQTVVATGHTDSVGDEAYNRELAKRRAQAVREHLLAQGLDPALVQTQAVGAARPAAPNDKPEGRALNRRTEVVFTGVRPLAR